MSRILKLNLKQKSGLLTELESDTIFGHFCWRMKEIHGTEKLSEFLELYKDNNPVFTISNSFFERDNKVFLPNPLIPHIEKEKPKTKNEKIKNFLSYKNTKKRKFLTLEQFNYALKGRYEELETLIEADDTSQPRYTEDLRTSVEISRETFLNKKGQLFSYSPMYINEEIVDTKKQTYTDTKTIVFLKIIDENLFIDYKCELILKEVFVTGYGKKKSSGYGEFEVMELIKFEGFEEPEDANGFVTLSTYFPFDNDGLEDYFYDFKVKYGKLGEELALSGNPFKKPMVMLLPGSIFRSAKKNSYGRCTAEGEISELHKFAIQNGIAFSLKCKI